MAEYVWRPLGELLIERGLIDRFDLEVALKEQKLNGQLLGELLVRKRLISPMELAAALAAHHGVHLDEAAPADEPERPPQSSSWRPLGRILVDHGWLTESGLQRALIAQRRLGVPLGEVLLQRGWVTPQRIAEALAEQQGLQLHPSVAESARELDADAKPDERYELRRSAGERALFVSHSYLDATDFAFELLHASDPDTLEIFRIGPGAEEERVWTYTREASESFRAQAAEERKRFMPLELTVEPDAPTNGAPSAA